MENVKIKLKDSAIKQNNNSVSSVTSSTNYFDDGIINATIRNPLINSFEHFSTTYSMCHQEMWMPPSQSYLHFDNQKVDQFSQQEKLQAVAKKKAKPKKTIKQISTTDLVALECSYRNDFKYKSAGNCKKLGLQFGLNYTQVRRWFIKREEKDEHNRSTSNKSKRSEQPATKILPVFPTSEIKCDHAKEGMLKMPRDAYFTGTQERKITTENAIQQWRNNPNLRPPVNELYLSNISDYPLFGYRGNNYEMNL